MSNKKPTAKNKPAAAPAPGKGPEAPKPAVPPQGTQAAKAAQSSKVVRAQKIKSTPSPKPQKPSSSAWVVETAPAPLPAPPAKPAPARQTGRKTAGKPVPQTAPKAVRKTARNAGAAAEPVAPAPLARRSAARPKAQPALAAVPDGAPDVAIYQIFFEAAQRPKLDPAFIPLDNSGRHDPLLEFAVFERLSADEGVRLAPLWGAVSWRFKEKSGLSGKDYLDAVRRHPGHDLYFCNPTPENEGLYANGWQQGITVHPAFREACEAVFKAAGLDPALLDAVTPSQLSSSCNYFVGSERFWNAYLPFVRSVVERARARLPAATLAVLDSNRGDPRNLHAGATYWPFIVERILPVFLRGPGADLKVLKIPLPAAESRLNSHVQRLREMKDVAHRTRSQWLVSCWVHYRNLFLLQAAGREWCKQYLPLITPKSVEFL